MNSIQNQNLPSTNKGFFIEKDDHFGIYVFNDMSQNFGVQVVQFVPQNFKLSASEQTICNIETIVLQSFSQQTVMNHPDNAKLMDATSFHTSVSLKIAAARRWLETHKMRHEMIEGALNNFRSQMKN